MKISKEIRRFYFSIFVMAFFLGAFGEESNAQQKNTDIVPEIKEKATSTEETVEFEKKTHQFLDLVKFDYPKTWKLFTSPSVKDIGVTLFHASANEDHADGLIIVQIASRNKDELIAKMENIFQEARELGLHLTQVENTLLPAFKLSHDLQLYEQLIYEATHQNSEYSYYKDVWVITLMDEHYYYLVSLITPDEKTDALAWKNNMAAFKFTVETMRHGEFFTSSE